MATKDRLRAALIHPLVNRWLVRPLRVFGGGIHRLPVRGTIRFDDLHGRSVCMVSDGLDPIASAVFWRGVARYEPSLTRIWARLPIPDRCCLDVGANTGLLSLLLASYGCEEVHAFEPVPDIARRLRENVRANGFAIRVHELAVSDEDGTTTLYVPRVQAVPSSASVGTAFWTDSDERTTPCVRLDTLRDRGDIGPVGLVKIDVEGGEPGVLRGMRGILERDRPRVVCEILPDHPRDGIQGLLEEVRYRPFTLEGRPIPDLRGWVIRNDEWNFLFLPEEDPGPFPAA